LTLGAIGIGSTLRGLTSSELHPELNPAVEAKTNDVKSRRGANLLMNPPRGIQHGLAQSLTQGMYHTIGIKGQIEEIRALEEQTENGLYATLRASRRVHESHSS
jgi:hypothetical protein